MCRHRRGPHLDTHDLDPVLTTSLLFLPTTLARLRLDLFLLFGLLLLVRDDPRSARHPVQEQRALDALGHLEAEPRAPVGEGVQRFHAFVFEFTLSIDRQRAVGRDRRKTHCLGAEIPHWTTRAP